MQPSDFPKVLLTPSAPGAEGDFIEVHIYGSLHRQNIERLSVRKPRKKADQVLLKEIEKKLRDPSIGAKVIYT
jgi:hypothetical protein